MDFMEFGDNATDMDEEMLDLDSNSHFAKFDATIGNIEDIIMSDEFQSLQNNFCNKYCNEFDETEENKFIYTDIHKEYTDTIETFLVAKLKEEMPEFSMEEFFKELGARKLDSDQEGEIFEILFSFSDFLMFKEMMVSHRKSKDNPGMFDDLLSVTPLCQGTGSPEDKESMPSDSPDKQRSCLQLSGLSIQCCSSTAITSNLNQEPAKDCFLKLKQRPSSSKGSRKPLACSQLSAQPTKITKAAKTSVPSTTKSDHSSSKDQGINNTQNK